MSAGNLLGYYGDLVKKERNKSYKRFSVLIHYQHAACFLILLMYPIFYNRYPARILIDFLL